MNKIFLSILLIGVIFSTDAQTKNARKKNEKAAQKAEVIQETAPQVVGIKWYSMNEALKLNQKKKRKILIDFYTDWCGWCKKMDKATYEDPKIAKYINENYYPVKFNAEREEVVEFLGKSYAMRNSGNRSTHELAIHLLDGKMGYPSTTFLNSDLSRIQSISGYLEPKTMMTILNYFGQDKHQVMQYEDFAKTFVGY